MFMDIKFKSVASFSENHKTFYSFACKKKKINEIRGGNRVYDFIRGETFIRELVTRDYRSIMELLPD